MYKKPKIALGFRGGGTSATGSFSPGISTQSVLTYGGGLVMQYFHEKSLGLQIEVNYDERGYKEVKQDTLLYQRDFSYVSVPSFMHLYMPIGNLHVFGFVGPEVSYLLNSGTTIFDEEAEEKQRENYLEKEPNQFTIQLVGGGGLAYWSKIGLFQADVRFYTGLTDMLKRPNRISTESSFHRGFGISFSYMIPISGFKEKKEPEEIKKE